MSELSPSILFVISMTIILIVSILIANNITSREPNTYILSETPSDQIRFTDSELRSQFNYFVSMYGKSYADIDEQEKRYQIFTDNMKYIYEHNLNSDKLGFILKINKFGDLSVDEFKNRYLGLKLNNEFHPNSNDFLYNISKGIEQINIEIPALIDWRDRGMVTNVKDQGTCKANWAFSTIAAIESANRIVGKGSDTLSEQQIIDWTDNEVYQNSGWEDGTIASWYYYSHFNSLWTDAVYPYKGLEGNWRDFALWNTKHLIKYFKDSKKIDKLQIKLICVLYN